MVCFAVGVCVLLVSCKLKVAGGGKCCASAVLGDPNAERFGTRLRTIRLKKNPPDPFINGGCPLRLQLPTA